MNELQKNLISAIELAQSRGAFSLEEAAIIAQKVNAFKKHSLVSAEESVPPTGPKPPPPEEDDDK